MSTRLSLLAVVLALAAPPWAPELRADLSPESPSPSSDRGVIVSLGMGPGSLDIAGLGTIQQRRGRWLFGARVAGCGELDLLGSRPQHSDTDLGLLVGRYHREKRGYTSASAGVALVRSVRRGARVGSTCDASGSTSPYPAFDCLLASDVYEELTRKTLGLAFDLKAVLSSKHAGVGVSVFGDVNARASFYGVALTVELGNLR